MCCCLTYSPRKLEPGSDLFLLALAVSFRERKKALLPSSLGSPKVHCKVKKLSKEEKTVLYSPPPQNKTYTVPLKCSTSPPLQPQKAVQKPLGTWPAPPSILLLAQGSSTGILIFEERAVEI